jgi:hypothetical protein
MQPSYETKNEITLQCKILLFSLDILTAFKDVVMVTQLTQLTHLAQLAQLTQHS